MTLISHLYLKTKTSIICNVHLLCVHTPLISHPILTDPMSVFVLIKAEYVHVRIRISWTQKAFLISRVKRARIFCCAESAQLTRGEDEGKIHDHRRVLCPPGPPREVLY